MIGQFADRLISSNIYKDFGNDDKISHVLKGVSVEFCKGTAYAIKGVSGSGKSTFMHILGGLDFPSGGSVTFNGKDIYKLKQTEKEKFLNQTMGFVFQFHYLIKELTVLENIMLVGLVKGECNKKCRIRAFELLESMGLNGKENSYPGQLSGGEQQRVSIARAIFNKPSFLLADEPTGNLDSDNAKNVVDLILRAKEEWGMGVIICSHDPDVYTRMEVVYTLHDGLLVK
ncbi:MAG: ABC transporter ATP-binding protein [Candidatus Babeliales bacterium]|jgi:ABC-type lipoprotein export system ATPase subunit|nr:MAG: ABC transporter, ATP-binding protein [candidate division TM6 bacterium GW2011_GWF2_36_6]